MTSKSDVRSEPVVGKCWKQLDWVPAKHGSISGRVHDDVAYVTIRFTAISGKSVCVLRSWQFDTYEAAKSHYDCLAVA